MKIVYLAKSKIPSRTANSIHVMKMCDNMCGLGYDVTLLIEGEPPKWEGNPENVKEVLAHYGVQNPFEIAHVDIGKGRGRLLRFLGNMARALRHRNPDFAYGRNEMAVLVAAVCGIPCALELHDVVAARVWYVRVAVRILPFFKAYKGTVVISNALKAAILDEIPALEKRKVLVAHDGADHIEKDSAQIYPKSRVQIGYVGHLYKGRGIENVIYIAEKFPDMDVHIVGGMEEDIEYWKKKSTVGNLVFHGHVSPVVALEYQQAMDILLAPYQRVVRVSGGGGDTVKYMSPLKIFEYMASGRAIICSDLPVLREVLVDSCAILVPPEDKDAWVEAVSQLESAEKRARLGENAKELFEKHYTWERRTLFLGQEFGWGGVGNGGGEK